MTTTRKARATPRSRRGGGGGVEALPSSSCTGIEFKGEGEPDYLIASDLPMQGSSRTQTVQMVKAIRFILEQNNWKAGDYNIGYQVCDDATAQAGKWDSGKCSQNAQAYSANEKVDRRRRHVQLRLRRDHHPGAEQGAGRRHRHGLAGEHVRLPHRRRPRLRVERAGQVLPDGHAQLRARGRRTTPTRARLSPSSRRSRASRASTSSTTRRPTASASRTKFRNAVESLGIKVAGFAAWDPKASSYEALMRKIGGTDADAVFLGGLIDENGAPGDQGQGRRCSGRTTAKVKLFAPDGFTQQSTIDESGVENAAGMFLSVAGVPIDGAHGRRQDVHRRSSRRSSATSRSTRTRPTAPRRPRCCSTPSRRRTAPRGDVIAKLFETKVEDGILGTFEINENGDPAQAGAASSASPSTGPRRSSSRRRRSSPKQETSTRLAGREPRQVRAGGGRRALPRLSPRSR